MPPKLSATPPIGHSNQRSLKIDDQRSTFVLINQGDFIYINAPLREDLEEIAAILGIENPVYENIQGKERQYGYLTGYLLQTKYKNITGAVNSIRMRLRKNKELNHILLGKAA